jgi:formate-dependent nitrite reductase membrane component NrfD
MGVSNQYSGKDLFLVTEEKNRTTPFEAVLIRVGVCKGIYGGYFLVVTMMTPFLAAAP